MLGGWYGAKITNLRGYMTNPQARRICQGQSGRVPGRGGREGGADHRRMSAASSQQGGTWQNRWPTEVEFYESEWSRFKAA